MRQILAADLIVLSKIDLIDESARVCVREFLRETVPHARFIEACHGWIPWDLLLGVGATSSAATAAQDREHKPAAESEYLDATFVRSSFESDRPFDRERLASAIETLPESVLRAKGVLYLADEDTYSVVLQKVGRRWTLGKGSPWECGPRRSRLIVIGACGPADISHLIEDFRWALADEPVATP